MNVATIIRDQIRALDRRAFMAWGAKDFVAMGDGLKFKTSGLVKWKGYVYVKYDEGMDLYNVQFARIRNLDWKVDKEVNGVYVEDLVHIIDGQVG
jgi:hypothetical protein